MKLLIILFLITSLVFSGCKEESLSFEQCVKMGGSIMESYPRQCSINGETFVEVIIPGKSCVDNCGDGVCAEVVCQAVGCPCAESPKICPMDCR